MQREGGTPVNIRHGKISAGPALVRASGDVGRIRTMEKLHFDGEADWAGALSSDEGRIRAVETANADGQATLAEALSEGLLSDY